MTEESCSPVGYYANDIAVEDVLVSVVDSAQLADLLLEVRVCMAVAAKPILFRAYRILPRTPRAPYLLLLIDVIILLIKFPQFWTCGGHA